MCTGRESKREENATIINTKRTNNKGQFKPYWNKLDDQFVAFHHFGEKNDALENKVTC